MIETDTITITPPRETERVTRHPGTITARPRIGQCVRHGDVLIERVAALPGGVTPRHRRDLAPGSAHSHIAEDPAVTYDGPGGDIYIRADERWIVTHETHRHIILPAGVYRSWRQVEAGPRPAKSVRRWPRRRVAD